VDYCSPVVHLQKGFLSCTTLQKMRPSSCEREIHV
jgi:hypothetical protein